MKVSGRRNRLVRVAAIATATIFGLGGATAAPAVMIFHGIHLQKACESPVYVGDPYRCQYRIANLDDNSESITVSDLVDIVHSSSGEVSSGNILGSLTWIAENGASCTASGPARTCTLPTKGATITSNLNSFYAVFPDDFNLRDHELPDAVHATWEEPVCLLGGCPIGPQADTSGASATVLLFTPFVTTQLSPPGPVGVGTPITDQATLHDVSPDAGGTVSYAVYSDNTCTGLVQDLGTKTVINGLVGPSDPTTLFVFGTFWFQATYSGDANNAGPVSSDCTSEPITVFGPEVSVVTLLTPPGPVVIGTPITDQATIIAATANAGGTISYAVYSDNTCTGFVQDLGTKTVTNGTVGPSDEFIPLAAGVFWFQATYSGDANNAGPVSSGCATEPITVVPVLIVSSVNPSVAGQQVVFTATAGSATPPIASLKGTVRFYDDDKKIGTKPLRDGVATLSTNRLHVGDHTITATFTDPHLKTVFVSPPLIQRVLGAPYRS